MYPIVVSRQYSQYPIFKAVHNHSFDYPKFRSDVDQKYFFSGDIMRIWLQLLVPPRVHRPGRGGLPLPHAGDLRGVGVRLLLSVQGRAAHQVQTVDPVRATSMK